MPRVREKFSLPKDQTIKAAPKRTAPRNGEHAAPNRPTLRMIEQGAIMAHNSVSREMGVDKDARFAEWSALKEFRKEAWRRVARDVYAIMESNRISVETPPSA